MVGSSQLTVNQETSESIISDLLHRLTTAESKIVGGYDDNANTLEQLKKLIAGLNEIRDLFKNSDHDTAKGIRVKNILESILDKLSINLKTHDDGQEVALRAVHQLKAEFIELNGIVSKPQPQLQVSSPHKASFTFSDAANPSSRVGKVFDHILTHGLQEEESESIIERLLRLTKVENLFPKNNRGSDNEKKMLDDLNNVSEDLNEISKWLSNSGHGHGTAVGAFVEAVLESNLEKLSKLLEDECDDEIDDDDQQAKPHRSELDQLKGKVSELIQFIKLQLTVNQEISESIIPAVLCRLITAERKIVGVYHDNANTLEQLKKLIAGLKEIRDFFKNSGHNSTAEEIQVKTISESILHKLSINLKTNDDGQEVALRAVQLKVEFDKLNEIVSKLQLQKISLIIQSHLRRLTKVDKNLIPKNMLSGNLENPSNLLMNSRHDTVGGALFKAILESILHKLFNVSINVGHKLYGRDQELAALTAEFDELKGIVLNLIDHFMKLQRSSFTQLPVDPGDSVFKGSLTITKINTTIIPAVVTRLELANKYSLSQNPIDNYQRTGKQVQKLTSDLGYIKSFLTILEENSNNLGPRLGNFVEAILRLSGFDNLGTGCKDEARQLQAKLRVLRKVVVKLKRQISPVTELQQRDSDDDWYAQVGREFVLDMLPVLHLDENFLTSSAFGEFREIYESLELTTKLCLLCFAVIPENEVVKKRFMTHWWEAEGFVSPPVEEAADRIFQELVKMSCIEPVNEKHKFSVNRYKMDPFIRTAVIVLAKEAGFFDFDDTGNPSANFKRSYRACLVKGCFQELSNELDPEKLQVLFNVNVPCPDYVFKFKGFSKLKNVKVLYLGRWQSSANHYIEVESTKFLTEVNSMKLLTFLSLQGIYGIRELPRSVCKLPHLRILDLRACHNLEALPDWIGSIRTLTHLDISECYLLHYIPNGIANLNKLQVLKGFLIFSKNSGENSCTLNHLLKLKKLRKLSIYIKMEDFPEAEDVKTLQKFKELQKLTITWAALPMAGSTMNPVKVGDNRKQDKVATGQAMTKIDKLNYKEVFETLEKLDLKCYPHAKAPSWLRPGNLPKLKKLYIRGGNLQNLSPVQENAKWSDVEVLRLKFLSDLKMDWKKLRSLFPGLIYLENFKCPNLTYFPCNENGVVWLKPRTEIKIE